MRDALVQLESFISIRGSFPCLHGRFNKSRRISLRGWSVLIVIFFGPGQNPFIF